MIHQSLKSNRMKMFNKNKDIVMLVIIVAWSLIDIISVVVSYSLGLDARTVAHIVNMIIILILWGAFDHLLTIT